MKTAGGEERCTSPDSGWGEHIQRQDARGATCRIRSQPRGKPTMTITLGHYLTLGSLLFALSVVGIFLNRKNLIVLLMAIELMLLAVNTNFVAFSRFLNQSTGEIFVFFILTVAAAEAAIGLAILVVLFRKVDTINAEDLGHLKG